MGTDLGCVGVGASASPTGPLGLRPEPQGRLGHSASVHLRVATYAPVAIPGLAPSTYEMSGDFDREFTDCDQRYAVRIGGLGGPIVAGELLLDRYRADLLCELLEAARESGREEGVEA